MGDLIQSYVWKKFKRVGIENIVGKVVGDWLWMYFWNDLHQKTLLQNTVLVSKTVLELILIVAKANIGFLNK